MPVWKEIKESGKSSQAVRMQCKSDPKQRREREREDKVEAP